MPAGKKNSFKQDQPHDLSDLTLILREESPSKSDTCQDLKK
jgi:hypothetical protein